MGAKDPDDSAAPAPEGRPTSNRPEAAAKVEAHAKAPSAPPASVGAAPATRPASTPPPSDRRSRVSSTPPPVPSPGPVDEDPLIGAVLLDRVRIDRAIARGGMGKVYLGELVRMKRACAIKVLDPRLAGGADVEDFTRRFLLEASTAAKLMHPNVVTIFDYGEIAGGCCFIAMELLDGKSLADELKVIGAMNPERAIQIVRQVARALREAHAMGVVHRDMKPGNVFLLKGDDDDDVAKVLDFGLVKDTAAPEDQHTQFGKIMGSPRYMAPEQVQGKPVDARTDVYAVGAMLYTMVSGKPLYDKPSDLAILMAQVTEMPRPIAEAAPGLVLPDGLEAVILKCLAKRPSDRYESMDELIGALKLDRAAVSAAAPGPLLAPPILSPLVAPVPPPKRSALPIVLAAAAAIGLAAALSMMSRAPEPPAPPAVAPQPPPAPAPPPPSAAPAPPPRPAATATLHVESDPPGARVREEGETKCESTPCDIVYTGPEADLAYEHLLSFVKGDLTATKITKVGAPLSVKLSRR